MARNPASRALHLLSLLQSGADYTGAVLADRLGVSTRTVRRDADRLRQLGYRIETRPGPGGTYRLAAGSSIPPLLFDEDEITVVIAGLRLVQARLDGDDGDDVADRALGKLSRVLPRRLARRLRATDLATEVLADSTRVPASMLGTVADAIAEQGRIRFTYRDQSGRTSRRLVDPYRHVLRGAHSYLVGYDQDREDWRLFRFDRVDDVERVAGTYRPHEFPETSIARWFATDFGR
ncbi:helix-turn-helix transcriptional regulator [Labedaea rhizosphaerae]|uniref:HTH domain-containing protein n=1 Tax=Labedaea rhizosphaerae TaxID=598644 RepID=A0A4R6SMB3_LABRH|nr:WYL domain-containing protein [Labedaea rhizosphaerae]TDQ04462.1 HTH domain-containing protein [Labedaea rhizosphaerae]